MNNPWYDYAAEILSKLNDTANSPVGNRNYDFVLPADRTNCADFEDIYVRSMCLQTYLPPLPYVGDPRTADIIVLAANPGFIKRDNPEYNNEFTFVEQSLKALMFESDYPIHYLDERFNAKEKQPAYPGYTWWNTAIKHVVKKAIEQSQSGLDRRQIHKKIAGIEWLPYHSHNFDKSAKNEIFNHTLPSQEYTKWLVNKAIDEGAQLVVIWGKPHHDMWTRFLGKSFPDDTIIPLPNAVRPKNLCTSHFSQSDLDRVVKRLTG